MRSLQTTRNAAAFKAALLAGGAGVMTLAQPAFAQDAAPVPTQEPVTSAPTANQPATPDVTDQSTNPNQPGIVVTGSRIVKKDFESNSPIVTVDQSLLQNSSTAAIETNLNKLPQFVPSQTPALGADIQPTATNTPGAATISLRGIGSNRSLVLIDGRRGTPANATGVVDINTIPSAALERVEIISGGASATYGADAVAGVTNFILKKNFQGLQLDGQAGISEHGDGFEYQISGIMGADFDDGRGNVSLAMSTNKRSQSLRADRKWYQDAYANPEITSTSQFFTQYPSIVFDAANMPTALGAMFPQARLSPFAAPTVYSDGNGHAFLNTGFTDTPLPQFGLPNGVYGVPNAYYANLYGYTGPTTGDFKVTNAGLLSQNSNTLQLVLPLTRYNFLARGNYEINDWIGVFGQAIYSHNHTFTRNEPGPIFAGWGATADPTQLSADDLPADLWTLLNSRMRAARPGEPGYITPTQANPNPIQPTVSGANDPFTVNAYLPDNRTVLTDQDTFNMVGGLQGSVPGTDWTWDVSVNHGMSSTYTKQTGIYSLSRVRALIAAPHFGQGATFTGNAASGGFGASTATCTSGLNFYLPPPGGFSEDCLEAIRADLKNRSFVRQTIWEANATGTLFELPAGPVQLAVGADYRENHFKFDNDTLTTQGRSFQDQALGIYPSGNVDASINTKEVYGELAVPIIKDSFIKELSLELGGRISDYNTTGTSYTYKALANFAPVDWLRFRGGYNRAERSPNIAELYLSPQQTFAFSFVGDPCSLQDPIAFSANPATNPTNAANVEAVCRVLMNQTGDPTTATNYYNSQAAQNNSTFGAAFPSLTGNPSLRPETADTWTAGVVISSPFSSPWLSRLRLTVDYYNIKVNHAIGAQSTDVALRQCFDAALNPLIATDPTAAANTLFCQNVPRNAQNGGLGNVTTTYVNNGRFQLDGIDAQLDWSAPVGPGTLSLNSQFSYLLHMKSAALPTDPLVDYAGTQGPFDNGLNGSSFRWKLFSTVNYAIGGATIGLQWQHLPSIDDSPTPNQTTGAPSYDIFHLNGSYAVTDNVTIRAGVNNLFNQAPPITNENLANVGSAPKPNLVGGNVGGLSYDDIGRTFYLGANMKF